MDVGAWEDDDSTLLLWHYAGAESLARDPDEIRFDRWGREVEYTFKPGPATLARVGLYQGQLRLLTIAVEMQDRRVTLRRAAGLGAHGPHPGRRGGPAHDRRRVGAPSLPGLRRPVDRICRHCPAGRSGSHRPVANVWSPGRWVRPEIMLNEKE